MAKSHVKETLPESSEPKSIPVKIIFLNQKVGTSKSKEKLDATQKDKQ